MSHVCKRIFKIQALIKQLLTKYQFSRYWPKFHIFTNIVIFQVFLQLFRPTASSLQISWQGHVRNTLFHFCQLPLVNQQQLNAHNWTSCFLFSSLLACFTVWPCFSVVYCCTFCFVSGHTVCVCFFLLSYIVHCNSALGPRFCANKIISYHIIYHIILRYRDYLPRHHLWSDLV